MRAQLYVGQTEPTAESFHPIANRPGGWPKPLHGLWTSTYDPQYGSGWVQWCLRENYGVPADGWLAWVLKPDPAARVLTISSLADLERTCAQYADTRHHWFCSLNFELMARDYDAVRLTEAGQWATHLSHPHSLYGWDCESTVWLRWIFVSVESLGRCTWPSRE